MQAYGTIIENYYRDRPWYGASVLEVIQDIDHEMAVAHVPGSTMTIARLIAHVISWRYFVIEKLKENADFDIVMNTEEDWPEVMINDDDDWQGLLYELEVSQTQLIAALSSMDEDMRLDHTVPGKDYNYQYLLTGITQHDVYHLGQIALIKKMMR